MKTLRWAMLVLAVAAGCGDKEDPVLKFVGLWKYVSGMPMVSCPGLPIAAAGMLPTLPLAMFSLERGMTSDLQGTLAGTKCVFLFDVKDKVATARPNQMCSVMTGRPDIPSATVFLTSWVITAADAMTADSKFVAQVKVAVPLGMGGLVLPVTCDVTGTGNVQKAPPGDGGAAD